MGAKSGCQTIFGQLKVVAGRRDDSLKHDSPTFGSQHKDENDDDDDDDDTIWLIMRTAIALNRRQ